MLKNIDNKNLRGDDLVHINDHYYQTIEYSQIFLHERTLSFLNKQNLERHLTFDKSRLYINTIKQWFIKNVDLIDRERFVIMGSGVLYVFGIRECRDVDGLMLGTDASEKLIEETAKAFYIKQTKFPFADLGIIYTKYWKDQWTEKDKDWFNLFNLKYRDELLFNPDNYFYFNGLKFMTLKLEILRKYVRNRYYDIGDMLQIMELTGTKINLPKIDMNNNEFMDNLKMHFRERYNMSDNDINELIKKYI